MTYLWEHGHLGELGLTQSMEVNKITVLHCWFHISKHFTNPNPNCPYYSDVIISAMALKSPASRLFAQSLVQARIKENVKAPRHWPLYCMLQRRSNEFMCNKVFVIESAVQSIRQNNHGPIIYNYRRQNDKCRFIELPSHRLVVTIATDDTWLLELHACVVLIKQYYVFLKICVMLRIGKRDIVDIFDVEMSSNRTNLPEAAHWFPPF